MPIELSQKGKLLNGTVEWIGIPFPEARFRTRAFAKVDLLPRRQGLLTDRDVALYALGLLCSETIRDAASSALRYGGFGWSSMSGEKESFAAIERLLPPLRSTTLLPMMSAIVRRLAENAPLSVLALRGTEPAQYEKFEIVLRPDIGQDVTLIYAPEAEIARRLRPSPPPTAAEWPRPIMVTRQMDGGVLEEMAKLAAPDIEEARSRHDE